jgi:hypothetical protein
MIHRQTIEQTCRVRAGRSAGADVRRPWQPPTDSWVGDFYRQSWQPREATVLERLAGNSWIARGRTV